MKGKLNNNNGKWTVISSNNNELIEYPLHPKELNNYDKIVNILIHYPYRDFEVVNEAYDVTKDGQQILYKDFAILEEPTDINQAAVMYASSSIEDFKLGVKWMLKTTYTENKIIDAINNTQSDIKTSPEEFLNNLKKFIDDKKRKNEC